MALVISGKYYNGRFLDRWNGTGWQGVTGLPSSPAGSALTTFDLDGSGERDLLAARWTNLVWDVGRPVVKPSCGQTGALACFGDGSSGACPCANESAPADRAGCRNSLGLGGTLRGSGAASIRADTIALEGAGMPNTTALYFQSTALVAPVPFGDGVKCTGGTFVRLATLSNAGGASAYPGAGDPGVAQRGQIAAPGTRHYQVRYRNAAAFCTSATFNYTNALTLHWGA